MHPGRDREARWCARGALVAAVLVAATTGCGSGQRAQRETEIATLRGQVEELKKNQDANAREWQRLAGDVKALDAQSAFLVGEAKTTSSDLGRAKATLEEIRSAIAELRTSVEDLRARASAAAPAPAPTSPAAAPISPPPAKPEPTPSSSDASPENMFASAMTSFQADEPGQAVLGWSELTRRFPEHPLASSAQYWIGEAYYRQRDFRQAIVEFRKVIDAYSQSPQVPEALLKIGLCFRELQDTAHARETWEQLTSEHPGTNAAAQARSLLGAPAPSSAPR